MPYRSQPLSLVNYHGMTITVSQDPPRNKTLNCVKGGQTDPMLLGILIERLKIIDDNDAIKPNLVGYRESADTSEKFM